MKKVKKIIVDKRDFNKLFLGEKDKLLKKSKKRYKWDDDKLFPAEKATCNQCGKKMNAVMELEKWNIPVCVEPCCPNFGLLQISVEKMFEFIDKLKKYE